MSNYRFSLSSLECLVPRSAEPYTDFLSIGLVAMQGGQVIGKPKASPYGDGADSRAILNFGPGTVRSLAPTFWGTGTDIVWEIPFNLSPGDAPVDIGLVVFNLRNVGDPYLLSRVLIHLGAIALGTGVSLYFGKDIKEAASAIVSDESKREVLLEFLGHAKDKAIEAVLPDWLFKWEWPDCAGDVLLWKMRLTPEDVEQRLGSIDIHPFSDGAVPIKQPEHGCRNPQYRVKAHLSPDTSFGVVEVPVSRRYIPERDMSAGLWTGAWRRVHGGACRVAIGSPKNRHYPVGVTEFVDDVKAFAADLPAVRESLADWTHHQRDVEGGKGYPGVLTDSPQAVLGAGAKGAIGAQSAGANASNSTPLRVGNSVSEGLGRGVRGGGGAGSSPAAPEPPTGAPGPTNSELSDLVSEAGELDVFARGVRTLALSNDVRLGLYRCVEKFQDGSVRETGPYVRYARSSTLEATQSDYMLINAPDVK